jgi:hypothetical protein
MQEFAAEIEPGVWIGGSSSRHRLFGAGAPRSVHDTQRFHGGAGALARLVQATLGLLSGSPLLWVRRRGGVPRYGAIYRTKAGNLLMFDRTREVVLRRARQPYDAVYVAKRREISGLLPGPDWHVTKRGDLEEAIVTGRPALIASDADKADVLARLMLAYEAGLAAEHTTSAASLVAALVREASSDEAEDATYAAFVRAATVQLSAYAARWPTILSHGDLSGMNVLITDDGYCVIDYDDVCEQPYFYDLALFAMRDRSLASSRAGGPLEDCLRRLASAIGRDLSASELSAQLHYVVLKLVVERAQFDASTPAAAYQAVMRRLSYVDWEPLTAA